MTFSLVPAGSRKLNLIKVKDLIKETLNDVRISTFMYNDKTALCYSCLGSNL